MRATIAGRVSSTTVKVNTTGGIISPTSGGVTLKNQAQEFRSLEDFADVVQTDVTDGATLVYNADLDKYEVKPLSLADLGGLDGGTF